MRSASSKSTRLTLCPGVGFFNQRRLEIWTRCLPDSVQPIFLWFMPRREPKKWLRRFTPVPSQSRDWLLDDREIDQRGNDAEAAPSHQTKS